MTVANSRTLRALALVSVLAGCNAIPMGSEAVVDEEIFQQVNLIAELTPIGAKTSNECKKPKLSGGPAKNCLAEALNNFYADSVDLEQRRNRISGSLRKASELQCAAFEQELNSVQSAGNLVLGSIATIAAGAGAIATSVDVARGFAATAGIASGGRAEYNADVFFEKGNCSGGWSGGEDRLSGERA
jgi:hypothetical protein